MHHQKLAIQVEDGDVKFIPFIPSSIFWKCDVHLLQNKLKHGEVKALCFTGHGAMH